MFNAKVLIICAVVAAAYGGPKKYKLSSKHLRLEGGVDATDGQFPFHASIQNCVFGVLCDHICGGVILNEQWILTGAACVEAADKVIVGTLALNENPTTKQTVDVEKTIQHPDYDEADQGLGPNDIGLIKLKTPLTYNTNVQAAKLPPQNQALSGTADISGYGSSFLPDFERLQYVSGRTLVSYQDCNAAITSLIPDTASPLDEVSNICTLDNVSNNCQGDIGGPLTQSDTVIGLGTWYIDPCGVRGAPNIFTNVAKFADWVTQTIASN